MADISKIKVNNTTYNIKDATARTEKIKSTRIEHKAVESPVSDVVLIPKINDLRANRFAFLPPDQIIIEKTIDGGQTWTDAGVSDETKKGLFAETRNAIYIPTIDGHRNTLCGLRVTITAMKYNVPSGTSETNKYSYWNSTYVASTERYNQVNGLYFWISSAEDRMTVKVETAKGNDSNNWIVSFDDSSFLMSGWSGNDYIPIPLRVFGGSTGQTNNYWNWRITFMTAPPSGADTPIGTSAQSIAEIRGYGPCWWTRGNNYASSDHLYSWDYDKNATFPGSVKANGFIGNVIGNVSGKVNNHTVNKDVPSDAVFTDTTYESKQAVSGGTDVSLVTTGEKYAWNAAASGGVNAVKVNGTTISPVSGVVDIGTVVTDKSDKADKVSNATSGNFAALDANGNLTDSGHKHADYLTVANSPVEKGTGISSVKIKDFAGSVTVASGMAACVFGVNNTASGNGSVVFGINNSATQLCATAVGTGNTATASCSFAEGMSTKASSLNQHVQGKNNVEDANDVYAHIVGNGSSNNARSNAYSLTWTGDGRYAGDVYVGCSTDSSGGSKLAKLTDIPSITGKADKVASATNGNFAALDSNGNLTDSGKKASDFGTYSKPSGGIPKTDLASAVQTSLDKADSAYQKPSGGIPATDIASGVIPDITGKADRVSYATSGNFAALDSNGNLTDSGHKHSDYLTSIPVMSSTTLGGAYIDDTISSITVWHNPMNNKDVIMLNAANSADIKAGSSMNKPAVVYRQHESVYFGLSKAAGVDLASETVTVGAYPATSQTAIKSMLGVSEPTSIIDDTAGNGDTTKVWSADKVYDQLALKADKADTVLTTTLSRGRKTNTTVGTASFAFGDGVESSNYQSFAVGYNTIASGANAHAEGGTTTASGVNAHSEGSGTIASGNNTHAEGASTTASGAQSHAEGAGTTASGTQAHAEGSGSVASNLAAHAEGSGTTSSGASSHAEGNGATASGLSSHAEGNRTIASGAYSHVVGICNIEDNYDNWDEWVSGTSYAVGDKVKRTTTSNNVTTVEGYICKTANSDSSFTASKWYNQLGKMNYVEVVGNGTYENSTATRSNARALDWDGNEYLKGDLYVGCDSDSSSGSKVATESFVTTRVPTPPSSDGTYYLKCVVLSGTPTYSWATLPTANGVSF